MRVNNIFVEILLCTFIAVLSTSAAIAQRRDVPLGWMEIRTCNLSFFTPESLQATEQRPIDSCLAGYSDGKIELALDYGYYSGVGDLIGDKRNVSRRSIVISGKK